MKERLYKIRDSNESKRLNVLTKQHGINFNDVEGMVKKMNKYPVRIDGKEAIEKKEVLKHGLVYWRI